ncbi:hypothetical protein [Salinispora tropica]|uniref:Uncharacterized protein n=1 Tax=Salinispora tropica (strain ATCC BAA-916 / DSM 44818 / JCM 13857 / NBRC 105044 / CNB-440) TaxID=369723 RepID=A4X7F3_SALTO|nr:hypothetical protein [Salinispora tropica]ABP54803.1 hypothetical protein Strop_2355 [Salinispora tropica CNB-440]
MTTPVPLSQGVASRLNDLLIAPGSTRMERWLSYLTAFVGAGVAAAIGAAAGYPSPIIVVLAVLGFDLFGGAVVNATAAVSRRFHTGVTAARRQVIFVAAHVHLPVLALILPAYPWSTAITLYAGTLTAAVVVATAGPTSKRPLAFAAAAGLLVVAVTLLPTPPALAWLAPLLILKLLLGHLLPGPRAT